MTEPKKTPASKALRRGVSTQLVPFESMKARQRDFRETWARQILQEFDPEKVGTIVVNKVGNTYWIVDGQHREWACKQWLGEWKGQKIECDVYDNLSEAEEAELFLSLNFTRPIAAYDRFVAGVKAGREAETNIKAVCDRLRLHIQKSGAHTASEGAIYCVSTLRAVYERGGLPGLHSVLSICYEAFGDAGLARELIEGVSLIQNRYNGAIEDAEAKRVFGRLKLNTVRTKAMRLREGLGASLSKCVASVLIDSVNAQRKKKLPTWFSKSA